MRFLLNREVSIGLLAVNIGLLLVNGYFYGVNFRLDSVEFQRLLNVRLWTVQAYVASQQFYTPSGLRGIGIGGMAHCLPLPVER